MLKEKNIEKSIDEKFYGEILVNVIFYLLYLKSHPPIKSRTL